MSLKKLTEDNFNTEVRENDGITVVMFTLPTCAPCNRMKPDVQEVAEQMAHSHEINFMEASVPENQEQTSTLGIRSVPAFAIYDAGMVVEVKSGTMSKGDFRTWISESI